MEIWNSIVDSAFSMSLLEIIAVFFGIASVIYSKKENILVYPTGIISVLIYVYLCFGIKLYADMTINLFYFIMSIYGWYKWNSESNNQKLAISKNSMKDNVFVIIGVVLTWIFIYFLLVKFTDSDVPLIDSFTTSISFIGMWLMAWKKVENWIMWIIANLMSIPLYWYKGLHLTSIQFVVFTILAIIGLKEWKRKLQVDD